MRVLLPTRVYSEPVDGVPADYDVQPLRIPTELIAYWGGAEDGASVIVLHNTQEIMVEMPFEELDALLGGEGPPPGQTGYYLSGSGWQFGTAL